MVMDNMWLEVGGWRLEVGGWRLEVGGWRLWEWRSVFEENGGGIVKCIVIVSQLLIRKLCLTGNDLEAVLSRGWRMADTSRVV